MQTYKIYINDRPLILAEGNNILDFPAVPDAHLIGLYQGNKRFLLNYVDALEKGGRFDAITLFYPDFEKMKAVLYSRIQLWNRLKTQHGFQHLQEEAVMRLATGTAPRRTTP